MHLFIRSQKKFFSLIVCCLLLFFGLSFFGCSQEPPVSWERVESTSILSETAVGDYTYEVGKEWEKGAGPGVYFPSGFVKNDNQTMVSAGTNTLYYSDYKTEHPIESLEEQYEYIQMNHFVDSNGAFKTNYKEIQTGTIGDYACVKGEFEGTPLGDNEEKGWSIVFFTSPTTYGYITVYYTEEGADYRNELLYVIDSVQLEDGSRPQYSGTMELTPDTQDKSDLVTLIEQAQKLNSADYTSSSWELLQSALSSAIAISNNDTSRQSDYASRQYDLQIAIDALVEVPNPANYAKISYRDLARNPDEYKGEKITISGRVLQVSEGESENQTRVATSGNYDDVFMIGYDPGLMTSRILEDDKITVYGTYVGIYSYSAVSGATISVPALYADAILID